MFESDPGQAANRRAVGLTNSGSLLQPPPGPWEHLPPRHRSLPARESVACRAEPPPAISTRIACALSVRAPRPGSLVSSPLVLRCNILAERSDCRYPGNFGTSCSRHETGSRGWRQRWQISVLKKTQCLEAQQRIESIAVNRARRPQRFRQIHTMLQHRCDIIIILGFGSILHDLYLGGRQIKQRRHPNARLLHPLWLPNPTQFQVSEKRNFHRALSVYETRERVGGGLQALRFCKPGNPLFKFAWQKREIRKEIEVYRRPVPQSQCDCRTAVQNEPLRYPREHLPDGTLWRGQHFHMWLQNAHTFGFCLGATSNETTRPAGAPRYCVPAVLCVTPGIKESAVSLTLSKSAKCGRFIYPRRVLKFRRGTFRWPLPA